MQVGVGGFCTFGSDPPVTANYESWNIYDTIGEVEGASLFGWPDTVVCDYDAPSNTFFTIPASFSVEITGVPPDPVIGGNYYYATINYSVDGGGWCQYLGYFDVSSSSSSSGSSSSSMSSSSGGGGGGGSSSSSSSSSSYMPAPVGPNCSQGTPTGNC
jgi:hypothetical protein